MGSTEVLDAFDGLCDVFYGSPELMMYSQGDYSSRNRVKYIDHLLNNPDIDNIELARYEIEGWRVGTVSSYGVELGMHSAYDMSKYAAFKAALNKFTGALLVEHKKNSNLINAARRNTTPYWIKSVTNMKDPTDFIDLAHFADLLSKNVVGELKGASVALA